MEHSELYLVLQSIGQEHRTEEVRSKFWTMDTFLFGEFLDSIVPDAAVGEQVIEALRWESHP